MRLDAIRARASPPLAKNRNYLHSARGLDFFPEIRLFLLPRPVSFPRERVRMERTRREKGRGGGEEEDVGSAQTSSFRSWLHRDTTLKTPILHPRHSFVPLRASTTLLVSHPTTRMPTTWLFFDGRFDIDTLYPREYITGLPKQYTRECITPDPRAASRLARPPSTPRPLDTLDAALYMRLWFTISQTTFESARPENARWLALNF